MPPRVPEPCCSRLSWPLSVSKIASIHWRMRSRRRSAGLGRIGGVLAGGADQVHAQVVVEELLEAGSGEALVGQDDLPGRDEVMVDFEQGGHHLAFVEFRVGQAPG